MTQIDFLPYRYHEQSAKRRSQIWRALVLLLFGGVCLATAVGQHLLRRSVAQQLASVAADHAAARASNERFDRLQAELRTARGAAELYTYFCHPWPRTQILAAIVQPLPEAVSLSKLELHRESDGGRQSGQRLGPLRSESSSDQSLTTSGPLNDLEQLRLQFANTQTVVTVTGEAVDPTAVHQYVAQLGTAPVFAKAELVSLLALENPQRQGTSTFNVRLVVRAGYGEPNGPVPTESRTAKASPVLLGESGG